MKVDSTESKTDKKELLYDGGDENEDVVDEDKPKSRADQKRERYLEDCDNFKENLDKEKYKNGIVTERGVTDPLCIFIFIGFIITMISLMGYCIGNGDIQKYIAPVSYVNGEGVMQAFTVENAVYCGVTEGTAEFPKLYFTNFFLSPLPVDGVIVDEVKDIMNTGICVKACPEENSTISAADVYGGKIPSAATAGGKKAYGSRDLINVCMPIADSLEKNDPEAYKQWKSIVVAIANSSTGAYAKDLYLSSTSIYLSFATAIIHSLICIYLLSLFAEYVAWALIAGFQPGLVGGTFFYFG